VISLRLKNDIEEMYRVKQEVGRAVISDDARVSGQL